jgi:deazaflavin-dependent oxidoreductase (nitroreductase family)
MTATAFNQRTIDEFHTKKGRGVGPWRDNLLLMTVKGARSDDEITVPLVYRPLDGEYVVVASKGGAPDHPKWVHNIQVNRVVQLEIAGREPFPARARVLMEGPERDRLFAYMTEVWPPFADYQLKTDRTIPIVILEPLPQQAPERLRAP